VQVFLGDFDELAVFEGLDFERLDGGVDDGHAMLLSGCWEKKKLQQPLFWTQRSMNRID
jgi:hypothetical protein